VFLKINLAVLKLQTGSMLDIVVQLVSCRDAKWFPMVFQLAQRAGLQHFYKTSNTWLPELYTLHKHLAKKVGLLKDR